MPFDGRTAALTIPTTLEVALAQSGIEPIDSRVLDAHKAEELRRHPASWFYRHRVAVQIATLVLLMAVLVGVLALASLEHPVVGFAAALILLGAVIAQSALPVRGPAIWREQTINDLGTVHPLLRDSARRLQQHLPGVSFTWGELIQARITLDPYLIAEYGEDRAVLGIWDGDTLIAPAPRPQERSA
jgi:hypothetical protein